MLNELVSKKKREFLNIDDTDIKCIKISCSLCNLQSKHVSHHKVYRIAYITVMLLMGHYN